MTLVRPLCKRSSVEGAFYLVGDGDFVYLSVLTDPYLVRKAAKEG